jgi:hypothetical protein
MKKYIIITLVGLMTLSPLAAENLFVTARICPVFAEASAASSRLAVAKQGDSLKVLQTSGDWVKVSLPGGASSGFVQKLFLGAAPSVQAAAVSDNLQNISSVVSRRRASAYTTSAAAARGLSGDNIRERENLAFKDYDFSSIDWVEGFVYSDQDLLSFAEAEGIGSI